MSGSGLVLCIRELLGEVFKMPKGQRYDEKVRFQPNKKKTSKFVILWLEIIRIGVLGSIFAGYVPLASQNPTLLQSILWPSMTLSEPLAFGRESSYFLN